MAGPVRVDRRQSKLRYRGNSERRCRGRVSDARGRADRPVQSRRRHWLSGPSGCFHSRTALRARAARTHPRCRPGRAHRGTRASVRAPSPVHRRDALPLSLRDRPPGTARKHLAGSAAPAPRANWPHQRDRHGVALSRLSGGNRSPLRDATC